MARTQHLAHIGTDEARGKLARDFARAAFDKMRALGPRWAAGETAGGKTLAPALLVHDEDGSFRKTLEFGVQKADFDGSVAEAYNRLVQYASKPGAVVVARTEDDRNLAWTYDAANDSFVPRPDFRPGCCGTCGNCRWPQQKP